MDGLGVVLNQGHWSDQNWEVCRHQLLRLRYWRLLARVAAQKCKPPVSGEGGNLPADEPLNEKEFKTPEAANRILLAIECS